MQRSVEPVPSREFAFAFFALLQERDEDEAGQDMEAQAEAIVGKIFEDAVDSVEHFWPRFFALLQVLDHPDLSGFRYERDGDENLRVHPALLTAAAEVKISGNGRFPRRKLAERAESLRQTEFADWDWSQLEP